MLRAVLLIQYRRVTDGQTDGIAVAPYSACNASIATLRRAVKNYEIGAFKIVQLSEIFILAQEDENQQLRLT